MVEAFLMGFFVLGFAFGLLIAFAYPAVLRTIEKHWYNDDGWK